MPTSLTKGDSYTILGSYTANGPSGGSASCSSSLNGTVTNTSQLTTTGTHTITCTVTTGAGKKAIASKSIKITYTAYTATNLIKNGSFETGSNYWTLENASITTHFMSSSDSCYTAASGSYNLLFNSGYSMTEQTLDNSSPIINHKYYGRLLHLTSSDFITNDARFEFYYNDTDSGRLIFAQKSKVSECWSLLSSIQTITTSTYLSNNWRIRNFYVDMSPYAYVDDIMIIDLTETFGSGNEPDKEWCDQHITYFDGTSIIYK